MNRVDLHLKNQHLDKETVIFQFVVIQKS